MILMENDLKQLRLGLAGVGNIGRGVLELLLNDKEGLSKKAGVRLELTRVVDREIHSKLQALGGLEGIKASQSLKDLLEPDVDIVIELIGGVDAAKELVFEALKRKKSVVTANKALLSVWGQQIYQMALEQGVGLGIEASVGGGIPIIEVIRNNLLANRLRGLYGILNGTSNFILDAMTKQGIAFAEALEEAKVKGYAEADPTLDIEGLDTAHKLCVLLGVALDFWPKPESVYTEGITKISALDIAYGHELGLVIKLLAILKRLGKNLQFRVHPVMVPQGHLLAHVDGPFNAIYLDLNLTGPLLIFGQGAGRYPTASAVIADIVSIAGRILKGRVNLRPPGSLDAGGGYLPVMMEDVENEYYLRFMVPDVPGMVGKIATALGNQGVSILEVMQKERNEQGQRVPVVLLTHRTKERSLKAALDEIYAMDGVVTEPIQTIRIERFSA